MRLRNFFPRTLFNRLLIIILLPLLLVQLLTVTVFYVRHWNTVTMHMAQNLVADISAILSQIEETHNPIDLRIINLSKKLNIDLSWHPEKKLTSYSLSTNTYAEKAVKNSMDQTINLPFNADFINNEDFITIDVMVSNGVVKFKFNRKRVFSSTSWIFVSWSIGSSFMLFALTLVFISAQVRPIKKLARTAYNLGIGREVNNISITGANEVRLATRAVISMASRIRNQLNERTGMLAGVSHDLRTPLTRLRLQQAMFKKNSEVESMNKDINEMEFLISEYLSFAKEDVTEPIKKININTLFYDIVNSYKKDKTRIKLKKLNKDTEFQLRPQSFRRAITNIISNAIRYAKFSEVTIKINTNDDSLIVYIDDDGPGINLDKREYALRPFHRLETSRNKQTGGTGLGLSIATNITLSHGGSLELLDSPLGGLRVKISLPF